MAGGERRRAYLLSWDWAAATQHVKATWTACSVARGGLHEPVPPLFPTWPDVAPGNTSFPQILPLEHHSRQTQSNPPRERPTCEHCSCKGTRAGREMPLDQFHPCT